MMTDMKVKLTDRDLLALARESWIDADTVEAFGLYRVPSDEGAALMGRQDAEDYAGIAFPIYGPGDDHPKEYILRRDHPPMEQHNGKLKSKGKYLAPPGRGNRLLFGPGESVEALENTTLPILLVEGVKKTVAAWRLSLHDNNSPRFLVCGISGVWGWKGTVGKEVDPTGARVDVKGIIPDFDRITWAGRTVYAILDSDTRTNRKVAAARRGLVKELQQRGAMVFAPDLPELEAMDKTGFDDLLAAWGPGRVLDWIDTAPTADAGPVKVIPLTGATLPALPLDAFPGPLGAMVAAVATATETPPELAAMMGLATVAACTQRRFIIEADAGYSEPLNLWTVAALESGNRKTAVHGMMTAPLRAKERELCEQSKQEITLAESERLTTEARIKALRTRLANCVNSVEIAEGQTEIDRLTESLPAIPATPRLWAQDVTPEKLGALMADNGERLALLSDEGGLFDILAGRYSAGIPNLDTFLQAHAGAPVRVDRGGREAVVMDGPTLTIALSPQPGVLQSLTQKAGFRDRGLLARFLYVLPPSRLGYRTLKSAPVPESVKATYHATIAALLTFDPSPDEHGAAVPFVLRLASDAKAEWQEFAARVEVQLRPGGDFEAIKDWAGKLPGAALRVAGNLHCVQHAFQQPHAAPVSHYTMTCALAVLGVLSKHALAVFDMMGADPALHGARKVWAWIETGRRLRFSARDCFTDLRGAFPKMADLAPALEVLEERGYVTPQEETRLGPGRRPSRVYCVNPTLAKEWT